MHHHETARGIHGKVDAARCAIAGDPNSHAMFGTSRDRQAMEKSGALRKSNR